MFSKTAFVALLALPLVAQIAFAADCTRKYTVQEGDVCDGISAAQHVSTYQLAVLNKGIIDPTCSNLVPGQTLCLGTAGEDCTTTYTVQSLDSCEIIQNKTETNSTLLHQNNPQINEDCSNLYIGEVLCVAHVGQAPSPPAGGPGILPPPSAVPANPSATAVHPVHNPAPTTPTPSPSPASSNPDDDLPYCDEL